MVSQEPFLILEEYQLHPNYLSNDALEKGWE